MTLQLEIDLNAVIVAVTDGQPRVLVLDPPSRGDPSSRQDPSLPFGSLDPSADRTLELALRAWVREQTGIGLGYVEQLYTFGDRDRIADTADEQRRFITVAYLALVREQALASKNAAHWHECYELLPWEDLRRGRPKLLAELVPRLEAWVEEVPRTSDERRERVDVAFGLGGAGWDGDRVLDRYELLFESGLVNESLRDSPKSAHEVGNLPRPGTSMHFDHRRILATALGRLRGKIRYRPVVFELLSPTFTLLQLQQVVEALSGLPLHKQNFRRLVERGGLVEGTGRVETHTGGRPAELFRYRREVVSERPTPGVGLPTLPRSGES